MIRDVMLYGALAEQFGRHYRFDGETVPMIMSALVHQVPGFSQSIRQGEYAVISGPLDGGINLGEGELSFGLGKRQELHIIPIPAGGGGRTGGIVKTVIGVTLLGVGIGGAFLAAGATAGIGSAVFGSSAAIGGTFAFGAAAVGGITYGSIAAAGVSMTLLGVSSLLTPTPRVDTYRDREAPDERPSFLYNGPTSQSAQGNPIPLAYGKIRIGHTIISSGLTTEAI